MNFSKLEKLILVVDDEEDVRESICDVLALVGHDAVGAADGTSALGLLSQKSFDLIITDLRMPGMDGWRLLSALRADAVLRQIPVCVVSAEPEMPVSANHHIRKPFDLAAIVEMIDKLLGRVLPRRCAA